MFLGLLNFQPLHFCPSDLRPLTSDLKFFTFLLSSLPIFSPSVLGLPTFFLTFSLSHLPTSQSSHFCPSDLRPLTSDLKFFTFSPLSYFLPFQFSHLLFSGFPPSFLPSHFLTFLPSNFPLFPVPFFSSRQEPPKATGKCLFSLFSACFRGGATKSLPYLSCSPAPPRTGQAAFPHPAPRIVIQYASALRQGSRSLRILGFGHFTQISAWLKLAQVYALRWLLRLSHLNKIRVVR
jgi:hypothetical protein